MQHSLDRPLDLSASLHVLNLSPTLVLDVLDARLVFGPDDVTRKRRRVGQRERLRTGASDGRERQEVLSEDQSLDEELESECRIGQLFFFFFFFEPPHRTKGESYGQKEIFRGSERERERARKRGKPHLELEEVARGQELWEKVLFEALFRLVQQRLVLNLGRRCQSRRLFPFRIAIASVAVLF